MAKTVKTESKKWWQSDTMWTNLLTGLGAAGAFATGQMDKPTAMGVGIMALVNILLRRKTAEPLG